MKRPRNTHDPVPFDLEQVPLRDAAYVGALLGIPRKSVLQYAREDKLPSVRIGRHVRFVIADVQRAIDAQRPPVTPPVRTNPDENGLLRPTW